MMEKILLKTPVYIMDEGPGGAVGLFLLALLGLGVLLLGIYLDNHAENAWVSSFGDVFLKKIGIALMLTGLISGFVSLA